MKTLVRSLVSAFVLVAMSASAANPVETLKSAIAGDGSIEASVVYEQPGGAAMRFRVGSQPKTWFMITTRPDGEVTGVGQSYVMTWSFGRQTVHAVPRAEHGPLIPGAKSDDKVSPIQSAEFWLPPFYSATGFGLNIVDRRTVKWDGLTFTARTSDWLPPAGKRVTGRLVVSNGVPVALEAEGEILGSHQKRVTTYHTHTNGFPTSWSTSVNGAPPSATYTLSNVRTEPRVFGPDSPDGYTPSMFGLGDKNLMLIYSNKVAFAVGTNGVLTELPDAPNSLKAELAAKRKGIALVLSISCAAIALVAWLWKDKKGGSTKGN